MFIHILQICVHYYIKGGAGVIMFLVIHTSAYVQEELLSSIQ